MNQLLFYFLLGVSLGIVLTSAIIAFEYKNKIDDIFKEIYGIGQGDINKLCKQPQINNLFNNITINLSEG